MSRDVRADERRRLGTELAWTRVQLDAVRLRHDLAKGEEDKAALARSVERVEQEIARLQRAQTAEGTMSTHKDNYQKAINELTSGVVASLTELAALDQDRERYPLVWFQRERAQIVERTRQADRATNDALLAYQRAALADVRTWRAAAEAERDPMARTADELERARLTKDDRLSADDLVAQARAMLAANQPRRAALLLAVANDKGAKGTAQLARVVEDAIDAADPDRARARALEDEMRTNVAEFTTARLALLAKYGLGVTADGSMGSGASGEVAAASLAAKNRAWQTSLAKGVAYQEPDGVLASTPAVPEPV